MEDALGGGLSPLDVPPPPAPPPEGTTPDPSGAAESTNHVLNSFKSVREMIPPRLGVPAETLVSSWRRFHVLLITVLTELGAFFPSLPQQKLFEGHVSLLSIASFAMLMCLI